MDTYPLLPTGESAVWRAGDLRRRFGWRYLANLERAGILEHPWHGAFVTPPRDLTARILALQVAVGSPVVACHHTAAALWGFGVLRDDRLHVTTLEGRSLRPRTGVVLHQQVPRAAVQRHRSGLMVTDPADAAVDVARVSRPIDVLAVLDAARRVAIGRDQLAAAIARAQGLRGIRIVRDLHEYASDLPESPMESRTRFRVIEARLPAAEMQYRVLVGGRLVRLDLAWPSHRVGLEFDGEDFHTGDGTLRRDRARHNALTRAGWTMLYATATDIYRDPGLLTAQLADLLLVVPK